MTAIAMLPLATLTASGTGSAVDLHDENGFIIGTSLDLRLIAEASSGGTITVVLETSDDGATGWTAVTPRPDGFEPVSQMGVQARTFGDLRRFVRARYTVSAGSHQVALAGDAHVEYASPADFARHGLRGDWLEAQPTDAIVAGLRSATADIDGAIAAYYPKWVLPLSAWRWNVREKACVLVAGRILVTHGIEPNDEDEKLFDRAEAAEEWLDKISMGRMALPGAVDRSVAA